MTKPYHMVVIGAGAAGLTAAAYCGELGGKVAMIEKRHLGGDCTWSGCVPSKALLHIAKTAHSIRRAADYGISAAEPQIDMAQVRDYIQNAVHHIYQEETPEVFTKRGVEVIEGYAELIDAHTVRVGDRDLTAKNIVIATGARAFIPPIEGLDQISYHTNETFFDNDTLPDHLVILGAGAIGMELGQAYRRLGANVTIIGSEIMPRDDRDAVNLMRQILESEGIRIVEDTVTCFESDDGQHFRAFTAAGEVISGDMLLVAAGRAPKMNGLGLDAAGVEYSARGIVTDRYLRTNIPHIYAVGDVTTGPKLTHHAGFQGAVAGRNIMIPFVNSDGHPATLPWTTFTDPEVAQVGLTETDARQQFGDAVKVFTLPLTHGDRTVVDDDTQGFIKLVYRGSGTLLGATIVSQRAGEMIQHYADAMKSGGLRGMIGNIFAYPTYSDVARKAASQLVVKELFDSFGGRLLKRAGKALYG